VCNPQLPGEAGTLVSGLPWASGPDASLWAAVHLGWGPQRGRNCFRLARIALAQGPPPWREAVVVELPGCFRSWEGASDERSDRPHLDRR
jgi:hypothetical protein